MIRRMTMHESSPAEDSVRVVPSLTPIAVLLKDAKPNAALDDIRGQIGAAADVIVLTDVIDYTPPPDPDLPPDGSSAI